MRNNRTASGFVTFIAVIFLSVSAHADDNIALSFTGGSVHFFASGPPGISFGWSFTVQGANLIVTQVGYWDEIPSTPLDSSHLVGIWNAGGTLLGSATVQTNSPITDGFRYEKAPPIHLDAGQSYVIGAFVSPLPDSDNRFVAGADVPLIVSTPPEIIYGISQAAVGPDLTFPGIDDIGFVGYFGPNFQFVAVAVPEPATWALVITISLLVGCGWLLRRRRKARFKRVV